jgi:hypothetical protein
MLAVAAQAGQAHAQNVVAAWIQLGPGSSAAALANGSYGDQPLSLTPTILARAVVSNGVCPALTVDSGTTIPMNLRFSASALTSVPGGPSGATNAKTGYPQYFVSPTATAPANFANGTAMATTAWGECEAVIPAGHKTAMVGTTKLKLPVAQPHKIILLADTGCRLNGALSAAGSNQQNCSSPTAFPTAFLASYEATFKPDLIVHIGDWFYRDTSCTGTDTGGTETFPGCNTITSPNYEPWGDIFDSWNADVFYPMKDLLQAAPIIMTRGNHESCGRGARGWYALLDAYPYNYSSVSCQKTVNASGAAFYPTTTGTQPIYNGDFEPSYVVNVGGSLNFIVHDSSYSNDSEVDPGMAQSYDRDLTNVLASLGSGSMNIFTTHKPTFGLSYPSGAGAGKHPAGANNTGDWTEQSVFAGGTYGASAFALGVPANIGLFISGHIHQAQWVNLADNAHYAPQLIVGMGGSLLDADMNTGFVPVGNTEIPAYTEPTAPSPAPTFDNFDQIGVKDTVNLYNGPTPAASTPTVTAIAARESSHDEFGFAVLTPVYVNGKITGFGAAIYKTGTSKAGDCKIVLSPRSLTCNF